MLSEALAFHHSFWSFPSHLASYHSQIIFPKHYFYYVSLCAETKSSLLDQDFNSLLAPPQPDHVCRPLQLYFHLSQHLHSNQANSPTPFLLLKWGFLAHVFTQQAFTESQLTARPSNNASCTLLPILVPRCLAKILHPQQSCLSHAGLATQLSYPQAP